MQIKFCDEWFAHNEYTSASLARVIETLIVRENSRDGREAVEIKLESKEVYFEWELCDVLFVLAVGFLDINLLVAILFVWGSFDITWINIERLLRWVFFIALIYDSEDFISVLFILWNDAHQNRNIVEDPLEAEDLLWVTRKHFFEIFW